MPTHLFTLQPHLPPPKTTFSKPFPQPLPITPILNTPTFTIIKQYTHPTLPLYHMHLYPMED
ncbi:tRNA (adenosine(37)-N6)-threonylcarbamoyltransferase complex ATPase subunit type 1 TsaE, partial [Bacillus pumilus]|uniref:tRNA (adenosine(37)-N6)-threonylcarbamoyltransferase complex ATPase subunit type 1 TsaE n=1 Tax=Bacillus pumilus TaxID=1408 RepID=UPI0021B35022